MKNIFKVLHLIRLKLIRLVLIDYLHKIYLKSLSGSLHNCEPNERVVEYGFVFKSLLNDNIKKVLDVGTGLTALPHVLDTCGFQVTAIDNIDDYWGHAMFNRHYHVINDNILNTNMKETFDAITCVSVLEHIHDHHKAIEGMFSLLNPSGIIILTFPYNENIYIDNVYKIDGADWGDHVKYIAQVFSRNEINQWLKNNDGEVIDQEYWKNYTGKYHVFGDSIYPPQKVTKDDLHQLTCIVIKKKDTNG
jgi:2-polyprenyl-3-methyl-5-hydroxy-6-metoxy-1,4-benzoquinol methylase